MLYWVKFYFMEMNDPLGLAHDMANAAHSQMKFTMEEAAKADAEIALAPVKILDEIKELKALVMALSEVLLTDEQVRKVREIFFDKVTNPIR